MGELSRKTDANSERTMLGDCYDSDIDVSGCLEVIYKSQKTNQGVQASTMGAGFSIDASRSSSIYSGSNLQVSALQVLCCIKI